MKHRNIALLAVLALLATLAFAEPAAAQTKGSSKHDSSPRRAVALGAKSHKGCVKLGNRVLDYDLIAETSWGTTTESTTVDPVVNGGTEYAIGESDESIAQLWLGSYAGAIGSAGSGSNGIEGYVVALAAGTIYYHDDAQAADGRVVSAEMTYTQDFTMAMPGRMELTYYYSHHYEVPSWLQGNGNAPELRILDAAGNVVAQPSIASTISSYYYVYEDAPDVQLQPGSYTMELTLATEHEILPGNYVEPYGSRSILGIKPGTAAPDGHGLSWNVRCPVRQLGGPRGDLLPVEGGGGGFGFGQVPNIDPTDISECCPG